MTYEAAHNAIRTRFNTQITVAQSIATAWPNAEFDDRKLSTLTEWVRFRIDEATAQWASMGDPGNNINRTRGEVSVSVFTEAGTGDERALEIADLITAAFISWEDAATRIRFLVPPYVRPVGPDGKWYQINVIAPFERDDLA